jgi:RHS repeat-associated protein
VIVTSGALPAPSGTAPPVQTTLTITRLEYWYHDHLGSLIASTDHAGALTRRYAYDAFGKRREVKGSYDATNQIIIDWGATAGADRGYTEHEHLDDIGIIHMNGRLFDPAIARFMQADPMIQSPGNLQNYDRYQYCLNSPLNCTDPSGFSFWTSFRDAAISAIAGAADAFGCGGWCSAAVGAYRGTRNGGGFKGAVVGGLVGYYGYQVSATGDVTAIIGFAAVGGCANAQASGGSCRQGAIAGVMQSGGNYAGGVVGTVWVGCVSGRMSGAGCGAGARDAFGSWLGGQAGNAVAESAYKYIQRSAKVEVTGPVQRSGVQLAMADGEYTCTDYGGCGRGILNPSLVPDLRLIIGQAMYNGLNALYQSLASLFGSPEPESIWSEAYRDKALDSFGVPKEQAQNIHIHHVVAWDLQAASPARVALASVGIGVHDLDNLLPMSRADHQIIHTPQYVQAVNAAMQAAVPGGRSIVIQQINLIKAALIINGKYP